MFFVIRSFDEEITRSVFSKIEYVTYWLLKCIASKWVDRIHSQSKKYLEHINEWPTGARTLALCFKLEVQYKVYLGLGETISYDILKHGSTEIILNVWIHSKEILFFLCCILANYEPKTTAFQRRNWFLNKTTFKSCPTWGIAYGESFQARLTHTAFHQWANWSYKAFVPWRRFPSN